MLTRGTVEGVGKEDVMKEEVGHVPQMKLLKIDLKKIYDIIL